MATSALRNKQRLSCRELLLGAAAAAVTARAWGQGGAVDDHTRQSLAAAAEFLWSQQADDGGWHSPQYGVMRSGQALTPFVLDALVGVPEAAFARSAESVDRALAFIVGHVDERGCVGRSDPELIEYPIYSTVYALRCLSTAGQTLDVKSQLFKALDERVRRLGRRETAQHPPIDVEIANFLGQAQFQESNGFAANNVAFGGWGFDAPLHPGKPGHMDLAHTRRALQSLTAYWARKGEARKESPDYEFQRRAESFLLVMQNHPQAAARPQLADDSSESNAPPPSFDAPFDGGFYFSPVVLEANKGRVEDEPAPHWRSYATATCDGVLALLAAGVPRDDERVTAAVAWLRRQTNLEYPQGVPREHPEPWGAAIRFYHYAVRAEAYWRLDWPARERAQLAALVCDKQDADGSFVNRESPLMKEDDPVLCTALAVVALSNCLFA